MRKHRHDVEAGERGHLVSIDGGLGKVEGEDAFDQDNGKENSRAQDGEQTRQLHRPSGSLDEREEKDDGGHPVELYNCTQYPLPVALIIESVHEPIIGVHSHTSGQAATHFPGAMRPILFAPGSVNHRLPSDPAVIPWGWLPDVGTANSVNHRL